MYVYALCNCRCVDCERAMVKKNPPSVTATGQDTRGKMRMDQSFQNENTAKQKNFKEKMCAIMSF